ncbi:Kinesin, motor domain-containing protein [Cynara cardunculus var. scolymus]|uniref:Kinesin-like protein n=1 Tax=Cynara cardunculus var. scolymus TaxID=59895 RepID=A0A103XX35_CYNCS|nr:Kinesin, motor domain-containing protein [Cynara cardunculus var. scolymus]
MVSTSGMETRHGDGHEEKIFVSVRVRPLNEKEIARNESCDWECVNNNTIICKNNPVERSTYPTAYTFDRVYGSDSTTRQVYEEGAKRVALSALNGINSSIFAYGQTSSGKTYTMSGITQYALSDIFDQINNQHDREFVLKFSAIEIYNECVRDLLSTDRTPLRLLDDPETIESTPTEFSGIENASTLTASVNFVDLAGSERASQTLSAGTRLKEGCHINRSLLTLGTVIRKLRDSKLTRILQNSLGGNARTAIICTLSPARTHVEQSRNTLLFAVCAKEVRTSAQVNVVMSEKALVKQLQQEMARLQSELKHMSATNDSEAIIREKELQIEKMEQEMEGLARERDLARARLEEILRAAGVDQNLLPWAESGHLRASSWDGRSESDRSEIVVNNRLRSQLSLNTYSYPDKNELQIPDDDPYFFDNISPSEFMNQYFAPDPIQGMEETAQPMQSIKKDQIDDTQDQGQNSNYMESPRSSVTSVSYSRKPITSVSYSRKPSLKRTDDAHDQDQYMESPRSSVTEDVSYSRTTSLKRSTSCGTIIEGDSAVSEKNVVVESRSEGDIIRLCRQASQKSATSVDEDKMQQTEGDMFVYSPSRTLQKVMNFDMRGYEDYMAEATPKAIEAANNSFNSDEDWSLVFEKQRRKIIELWDECNIPLLHRTYFFLLITGEPSDSVYVEVELRRLSFLKQTADRSASGRALNLERAMLARKLLKKFSPKERDELFEKWGIDLESRNRRVQLSQLLWTKTDDIEHARDSAEIVAKLVGLSEPYNAPKELFALSFSPKHESHSIFSSWIPMLRY